MAHLKGRVALVTGSGRGIGAAIARRLAADGAAVAVADMNLRAAEDVAGKLRAEGAPAAAYRLDVRDGDAAQRVVAAVRDALGPVDVLVNNAGVTSMRSVLDLDEQEWDRVIDVSLKGTFLMCKAVLPSMIQAGYGRIINMSSILGKHGAPNNAHYCAAKFGIIGFTESLATEVGEHQITVNAVAPGIVESPMQDEVRVQMAAADPAMSSPADVERWMASLSPLGRTQRPEDIAEMVSFLAANHASNLTAGVYAVDGGVVAR